MKSFRFCVCKFIIYMHAEIALCPNTTGIYSLNYARAELWFQMNEQMHDEMNQQCMVCSFIQMLSGTSNFEQKLLFIHLIWLSIMSALGNVSAAVTVRANLLILVETESVTQYWVWTKLYLPFGQNEHMTLSWCCFKSNCTSCTPIFISFQQKSIQIQSNY